MHAGLINAGVLQQLEGGHSMPCAGVQLTMLDTLRRPPTDKEKAKAKEGEFVAPVPLEGYHANLAVDFEVFKGDLAVLKPFILADPKTPIVPMSG
jgi:hypothetical protein